MEGDLTFSVPKYFKASVSGQWQQIGQNAAPFLNVDAVGVSASAGVTLGPVQIGGAGFVGQGLGIYSAMEDSPIFSDSIGVIRHQQGVVAMASVSFGDTKIGGGAGVTQVLRTVNDGTAPLTSQTTEFPKQQLGVSVGLYQHIKDTLVLALEYFRSDITWQTELDPSNMTNVITPSQVVNFVNAGVTMLF